MESLWVEWEAERWTLLLGKEEREGRREELPPPLGFEFVFARRGTTVAMIVFVCEVVRCVPRSVRDEPARSCY